MHPPLDDTIVAIATGWSAARLGILRFSGPESFRIVRGLGQFASSGQAPPHWTPGRVTITDEGHALPAEAFWFPRPRSFTGQEMAELHLCGALPVLRMLAARAVRGGARAAVSGEFTARAYSGGKLDAAQVAAVLRQLSSDSAASARAAARGLTDSTRARVAQAEAALTELIGLVEAGIDFVDEEDVQFISRDEIRRRLESIHELLSGTRRAPPQWGLPRVVLAGRPNAGKSTLFNVLAGSARAIASPIIGSTRDVLTVEVELAGARVVLVDTPGRISAGGGLDARAQTAAREALDGGDLILWLHDSNVAWGPPERREFEELDARRRLLVFTKAERMEPGRLPEGAVAISALAEPLCPALRAEIALKAYDSHGVSAGQTSDAIDQSLLGVERAMACDQPELVSLEARFALQALAADGSISVDERILGVIFSKFCVGK